MTTSGQTDSKTPIEWFLFALEKLIRERNAEGSLFKKWITGMRFLSWTATVCYCIALVISLALLSHVGEQFWLTALLLYFPPTIWLLPLAILSPIALFFSFRQLLVHAICGFYVLFFYMDFFWSSHPSDRSNAITVVSNNIGQNNRQSLRPFLAQEKPDLILLQEAWGRGYRYERDYPDYHVKYVSEFILMSKFKILDHELVEGEIDPMAAWFLIDYNGVPVKIYNVHFLSPRRSIGNLRGSGFLAGFFNKSGIYSRETREKFNRDMDMRISWANSLREHIDAETMPTIVGGDFNMSSHGYIYEEFAKGLYDAVKEKGRGYNYSFPGVTRNPLSLFGPWMRIDYIFSNDKMLPIYAHTERGRTSQHRALSGAFIVNDKK